MQGEVRIGDIDQLHVAALRLDPQRVVSIGVREKVNLVRANLADSMALLDMPNENPCNLVCRDVRVKDRLFLG